MSVDQPGGAGHQQESEAIELLARAERRRAMPAVLEPGGCWSYGDLLDASLAIARRLLAGRADLAESRVGLAIPAGGLHLAAQWGCWRAGGVVVSLSGAATVPELETMILDAAPESIMTARIPRPELAEAAGRCGVPLISLDRRDLAPGGEPAGMPCVTADRRAMILYTSGTTSKPKGVVSTHGGIAAQVRSLVEAWRWSSADRIPLFLPLHHIHGVINIATSCLWAGGVVDVLERFESDAVLQRIADGKYSLLMAVPTIYHRLVGHLEGLEPVDRERLVAGLQNLRLVVSGSAALPVSVHRDWHRLTGQSILERYGMTEIGMALSHPYDGERRPGAVGMPLPGVAVRLVDDQGEAITAEGTSGELEVRGPTVFREYWNRPDATAEAFRDGWFRTGDVAVVQDGQYSILGRTSVDIIKSGGYKLSALEIEAALLEHPEIAECAVVGMPDEAWGEIVAVAVVARDEATTAVARPALTTERLRDWCRGRLSPYRIPRTVLIVGELPRNSLGKVIKPAVRALIDESCAGSAGASADQGV